MLSIEPVSSPGIGPVTVVTMPRSISDGLTPGPPAGPLHTELAMLSPGIEAEPLACGRPLAWLVEPEFELPVELPDATAPATVVVDTTPPVADRVDDELAPAFPPSALRAAICAGVSRAPHAAVMTASVTRRMVRRGHPLRMPGKRVRTIVCT